MATCNIFFSTLPESIEDPPHGSNLPSTKIGGSWYLDSMSAAVLNRFYGALEVRYRAICGDGERSSAGVYLSTCLSNRRIRSDTDCQEGDDRNELCEPDQQQDTIESRPLRR